MRGGINAPRWVLTKMKSTSLLGMFALAAAVALAAPLSMNAKNESLVLGGGCFWCTEAAYELLPGVKSVVSGYSGGKELNPTYEQICAKVTGHAEVIKIEFDPAVVTLEKLLEFFWQVHNPTQVGGQGNDHGPQYRSIILFADAAQKAAAEKSKAAAGKIFRDPLTTEIVGLEKFWPAEEYHQDYYTKNPIRYAYYRNGCGRDERQREEGRRDGEGKRSLGRKICGRGRRRWTAVVLAWKDFLIPNVLEPTEENGSDGADGLTPRSRRAQGSGGEPVGDEGNARSLAGGNSAESRARDSRWWRAKG